jgi:glycosyltransferase involved in cell wall biosynthesis
MEHCNDIVTYVGEVPSMRSVAEGKDIVLVFPIKPEPFGISALEAWQCGLPVLGIPAGGAAESLALIDGMRTGSDVLMIADDLTRLYDDPRGRWRHRPDWVPAQVLCGEQDRTDCWMRLLEMAVA